MSSKIIKKQGGLFSDDRGHLRFVNDFNFEGVKRFYQVENHSKNFIRAWHGHEKEGKYVYVSMDCTLDHPSPGEEEKEYTEWKGKSWQRDQLKFLNKDYKGENTKGFYD